MFVHFNLIIFKFRVSVFIIQLSSLSDRYSRYDTRIGLVVSSCDSNVNRKVGKGSSHRRNRCVLQHVIDSKGRRHPELECGHNNLLDFYMDYQQRISLRKVYYRDIFHYFCSMLDRVERNVDILRSCR